MHPPFRCVDLKRAGTNEACRCPDETCLDCTVSATSSACARCNATCFLGDGVCVRTLTCQISTYMHRNKRLDGRTCTCRPQQTNCVQCDITVAGVLDTGVQSLTRVCNSCRNGFYGLNGACFASCPAGFSQVRVKRER